MMIKHAGNMSFLEEKWLQDLVERVGHQLHTRKYKANLLYEVEKKARDIEHIQGRMAIARGELEKIQGTIEALQRQLSDSMGESKRLEVERKQAEEKFSRLKEAGRDMEKKLAALPHMGEDIKNLEVEVRRSTRRLEALRSDYGDTLSLREGLEDACKASRTGLADVEQEISVMKSTFTLLTGQMPEDFDPETFEAIQDNMEKRVDEFTSEMMGEIDKVKEDTLSLEARLEEKVGGKKAVLLKKGQLQEIVRALKEQVGDERSPEALEAQLDRMKRQEEKLAFDIGERKRGIQRLESALDSVMKRIGQEEKFGTQLRERHGYLKTRKDEMNQFGDVAEEIQRLGDEARRLITISKANRALHETVKELIGDLEPMNQKLGATLEGYERRFSEFKEEIEGLSPE